MSPYCVEKWLGTAYRIVRNLLFVELEFLNRIWEMWVRVVNGIIPERMNSLDLNSLGEVVQGLFHFLCRTSGWQVKLFTPAARVL